MLPEGHTAAWRRDNVVWVDICAKDIPGSPEEALDQEMAAKSNAKRAHQSWFRRIVGELGWLFGRR